MWLLCFHRPLGEFNQWNSIISLDFKNTSPWQGHEIDGICNHICFTYVINLSFQGHYSKWPHWVTMCGFLCYFAWVSAENFYIFSNLLGGVSVGHLLL